MKLRFGLVFAAVLAWAATVEAQTMPAHAFSSGGGRSENATTTHFSAVGLGMAVGTATGNGIEVHHGFLAGARVFANRDIEPPEFDPPVQDLSFNVGDDVCLANVVFPAITASDDRDNNPHVEVVIDGPNGEEPIDPDGETILLPPGNYIAFAVARDRNGNTAEANFRVDVFDRTAPTGRPIPNPTPVGSEVEADSPLGTAVAIQYGCVDVCDNNPRRGDVPETFVVGDTDVDITCTDLDGNSRTESITVRVRDTESPALAAQLPDELNVPCAGIGGTNIPVPQVVWRDNGSTAAQLETALSVNGGQFTFPIPNTVRLDVAEDAHVLRYRATDSFGNTATADLNVRVADNSVPRIEVSDLPASGWLNGDQPTFTFNVADDCAAADTLTVNVAPAANVVCDGPRCTVSYPDDGIYNLRIEVADLQGNTAVDNSVAFGIDRGLPEAAVDSPSQRGVDRDAARPADQRLVTYPFFGTGELMPVNIGAEEDDDGDVSGIRKIVAVLLRAGTSLDEPASRLGKDEDGNGLPDDNAGSIVLSVQEFQGNGQPVRGERAVANVACETFLREGNQPICSNGKLNLKAIDKGPRRILIQVEDFAGNIGYSDAVFVNGGLGDAMLRVIGRFEELLGAACDTCAGVGGGPEAGEINDAIASLNKGWSSAQMGYGQVGDYGSSRFLGGGLAAVKNAIPRVVAAADLAEDAAVKNFLDEQAELLLRSALSDLELFHLWTSGEDPSFGQARFVREAYSTDMELVEQYIDSVRDSINGRDWTQGASSALNAFFHLKMARHGWVMDIHLEPRPQEEADGERDTTSLNWQAYKRGKDILQEIADELGMYGQLAQAPSPDTVGLMRNKMQEALGLLKSLLDEGINVGLDDHEYLNMLMAVREAASESFKASANGAYLRVHQYAMMQVVRWLTHFSLKTAMMYDSPDRPLYLYALETIEDGVELLENRQVSDVIELYGSSDAKALCPIYGIYNCWFTIDEEATGLAATDPDCPVPTVGANCAVDEIEEALRWPAACSELGMLPPSQWDARRGDGTRPECAFGL